MIDERSYTTNVAGSWGLQVRMESWGLGIPFSSNFRMQRRLTGPKGYDVYDHRQHAHYVGGGRITHTAVPWFDVGCM